MATNSILARNAAYNAVAGVATHLSMHTADPGATGASEVAGGSYARIAKTYAAPTNGAGDIVSSATFEIPGSTTVTHWGAWENANYLTGAALASSQNFATAGQFTLTAAPYSADNPA